MKFSIGVVWVALLASFSCTTTTQNVDTERKVKCAKAQYVDHELKRSSFVGKVIAASDVNLGFRVAGIVEKICVKDGEFVREGDVVAKLDERDYKLQLAATQAEYNGIKSEVDRIIALYKDESVSARDYDKAVNGLKAMEAKLEAHKNALSDCLLRAPMDAYVVKTNFDKGEAVAAGTPVVSLISAGAPQLTIDIPTKSYLMQSAYKSAVASFELYADRKFNLKLLSVSPRSNLNQLYRATFEVEATKDGVLPSLGMSALVDISYATNEQRILEIPFTAVIERDGENSVWVVEDNVVSSRAVEIVEIKSDGTAYITQGLNPGEVVVAAGVSRLTQGQRVSVLSEPAQSNVGAIK